MATDTSFTARLESKIRQQLAGQRVGFLLGAGSSFLDGAGYPLSSGLWDKIKHFIQNDLKIDIQQKLDDGANGIEHALDLLDDGGINETGHRHGVTDAIAEYFPSLRPPLDIHIEFLKRLAQRREQAIPIFNLNYDPLVERAADAGKIKIVDGFVGSEVFFFDPASFQHRVGILRRRGRHLLADFIRGHLHLYKLHGSLGWYESPTNGVRRAGYGSEIPANSKRLMIPPQHRKAVDTMAPPYSTLWSELRASLSHGPNLINRLACIGYGMQNNHVNAAIEISLSRNDFTLLIFARDLPDSVFNRWSPRENIIIVTNNCCSLYGETGPAHQNFWKFEQLAREV